MRVLAAFDKFKDSLTAGQACSITATTLRERHPDWTVDVCPLTDGGDGFCEILTAAVGGTLEYFSVTGPRGELVRAPIGFVDFEKIPPAARALLRIAEAPVTRLAIVEMAAASGLALLPESQRDPWKASSVGTGQLLRHAAERGATGVLLGVGGSATHDLGLGVLQALGVESHSATGAPLTPGVPENWPAIARFHGQVEKNFPVIRIACDVSNPLLGPLGAAAIYAPQKGLQPADYTRLESETQRVAALLVSHCGQNDGLAKTPGTGAAGGIAFGLMAAAGAQIVAGFPLVSAWLDLEARLADADLVLTGEGRFDPSSFHGKGPGAIVNRALELGKRVHVFAGAVGENQSATAVSLHAITPPGATLGEALRLAPTNLAKALRGVF